MNCEVKFWPSERTIKVKSGTTVLEAARRAGVPIRTRCGGKAACFMCKVEIKPGSSLLPMENRERFKLAGMENDGIRLSCQAKVCGPSEIVVPPDPLQEAIRKRLQQQAEERDTLW